MLSSLSLAPDKKLQHYYYSFVLITPETIRDFSYSQEGSYVFLHQGNYLACLTYTGCISKFSTHRLNKSNIINYTISVSGRNRVELVLCTRKAKVSEAVQLSLLRTPSIYWRELAYIGLKSRLYRHWCGAAAGRRWAGNMFSHSLALLCIKIIF